MFEIKAPFTDAEIEAFNDWQRWGSASAILCATHHETRLVAETAGWRCPVGGCADKRDWAPGFLMQVRYCRQDRPRPKDAPLSDYWVHVGAVEVHPEWEGDTIPFRCPHCGIDFEVEL